MTLPLAVPACASAAMGGANALTTALRPDLRSATVQSTNATDDSTTVRVCFSKAIASLPQASKFGMGNYGDGGQPSLIATSASRATANCADATFPNSEAAQHTYVSVDGSDGTGPDSGISAVSSNGFGNIMDSTALIGSNTHNGTRGKATGADLVGITVNNSGGFIDYTFDQDVAGLTKAQVQDDFQAEFTPGTDAQAFAFNLANGATVFSTPSSIKPREISGNVVRVFFPTIADEGFVAPVSGAVRAYVADGAVVAKTGGYLNHLQSVARPGNSGATDRPDLVAVTVSPDGQYVDYQFDTPLGSVSEGGGFYIGFSDSRFSPPGGPPQILGGVGVGNTVRFQITDGPAFNEYLVNAWVNEGAVRVPGGEQPPTDSEKRVAIGTAPNPAAGLPVGGNTGAFATGFTTAPEALQVSFDNATSVAHVLFDQRWIYDSPDQFQLIDDQGSQVSAAAVQVSGGGAAAAGKVTADVTFPPGTLAGARSLLIRPSRRLRTVTWLGYDSVQQVISPTAPASARKGKFRKAKALNRRQRAALRRR